MKQLERKVRSGRIQISTSPARFVATVGVIVFLEISGTAFSATNIVTSLADGGAGSLRETLANAAAGDSITFGVTGTVVLTSGQLIASRNLDIIGPGPSALIISGNNSNRVFLVNGNVHLALLNLTIAHGSTTNGAALCNLGGQVLLQNCTLRNNSAICAAVPSYSGDAGLIGFGGAVLNAGLLSAINCAFVSNSVTGGAGAIAAWPSGPGGGGGDGNGGAIWNSGALNLSGCLLANNSATGGIGGMGGSGPYGLFPSSGGSGGAGGNGNGGALFTQGFAQIVNTTFALNSGAGGRGGTGGAGSPPMSESSWTGDGGPGGSGGTGDGAICDVSGQSFLTNVTVAINQSIAGAGGDGGWPGPWFYPSPPRTGQPGLNGPPGSPGAGLRTVGAHLLNTILSDNTPSNCIGIITDTGHNLSSDASCSFIGTGSMTNTNPRLGPLADNGGPTFTLSLLADSPAIDAGVSVGVPAADQRGVARPQGRGVDIGAYEFQFATPRITDARFQSVSNFWLQSCGLPNQTYTLQSSTNLQNWSDVTNILTESNGVYEFIDYSPGKGNARFYRLRSPAP